MRSAARVERAVQRERDRRRRRRRVDSFGERSPNGGARPAARSSARGDLASASSRDAIPTSAGRAATGSGTNCDSGVGVSSHRRACVFFFLGGARFTRRVERPQIANLASFNFHHSVVVSDVSSETQEGTRPPLASRYADTCPVHDLAGPEDQEVHDKNGGLAPPENIKKISWKLAPHTFGAVLTAPHDTDVVCLNSALNAQLGYKFYTEQGYDVMELDDDAYARFGSVRRRAVSVFGSDSTKWGAWLVTREGYMPFFVTTTCHAGSTWFGPYAHQGYGWGKDRVGDIKMQQANLERGLAGKAPMPLETSAFVVFDFDPRRAQALVDERFREGSPPWTHPTVRAGQISAASKRKVQEKADEARAAFERARREFRPDSQQYRAAEVEAERWKDEADRVYNRGAYYWFVPFREAAERVRLAGDAASAEDRALARQWDGIKRGLHKNLSLGSNLQARAKEAEEVAARPNATDDEKAEAKRLRRSADKKLSGLSLGGSAQKFLSLWATARAPNATQAEITAFERARDKFRATRRSAHPYRNITLHRPDEFRAVVAIQDDKKVMGRGRHFAVGSDSAKKHAMEAAARDADVLYIALFRKWYADGDFDVDHPLALPLNFPQELADLQKRSRDKTDHALQSDKMKQYLSGDEFAPLLSAPVQDPAAAGPSGSGPSSSAAGGVAFSGEDTNAFASSSADIIELSGDEEDDDSNDSASSSSL